MDAFDISLRIATLLLQAAIPVAIFIAGRRIAQAQYVKSTGDAWNEFNKLLLANADNVRVGRQHFAFSWASQDDDAMRKAGLGFVAINALVTVFYGAKNGLLAPDYKNRNVEQILVSLISDDQLFELTQSRGYPPEFQELCAKLRADLPKAQSKVTASKPIA